ncbi:MAG: hypothetical protein PHV34_09725 [Verrucomicrobiae bacterium]|nr:hypothetical protein [Verrucomicrobiae bacterium]
MKKQPVSVTVIAWVLIASNAISLIASPLTLNNPVARDLMSRSPIPLSVQYGMLYFGMTLILVSGIAMLKGRNWGRLLYVIWSAFGFLIGVMTSPIKTALIPGTIIYLVIVFFLFCPKANRYFSLKENVNGAENH